ncbi:uncharacterized protein LOC105761987 [Gossypium raimondii]|uniref:uncharacterized protein LOC105761987 n=1 Tax=Gossypium raimondii TaxID=29730 RepID=UPI00063AC980|nr:uncharacterized protein LOC105761987 [Gossypium raimondii]
MANYVKFMKDILSKKYRLGEFETIALTEGCTTMLMNKLPPKLKDPRSFTISYSIGNHYVGKALCDLGASINIMPMSIFRKLKIEKAGPTMVTLQLVDQSYAHSEGGTLIDVKKGELTMRISDQQITFNEFNALKYAYENKECRVIGLTETTVEEFTRFCHSNSDIDEESLEQSDIVSFDELK